jgi:hypothetical protein
VIHPFRWPPAIVVIPIGAAAWWLGFALFMVILAAESKEQSR